MEQQQEMELLKNVATLMERSTNASEQDKEIKESIKLLFVQINKSNSEREADVISLKVSLKNKINDSIDDLKKYHDNDVKLIKDVSEKNKEELENVKKNLMYRLGENKKLIIMIASLIIFGAWAQFAGIMNKQASNVGIEQPFNVHEIKLRGETIETDSIN